MTIERNNPGNIEKDIRWTWQGEMPGQKAGDKLVFDTLENGSRAMIKDLLTKVNSGVDTINEIITKYAPPSENPTAKYIA
jgi:phosphoenolpyruvate carboxylase